MKIISATIRMKRWHQEYLALQAVTIRALGLEAKYDALLSGNSGQILTLTDAWGIELEGAEESRKEPVAGSDLYTSLDYNIQAYAEQHCRPHIRSKRGKACINCS